MAGKGSNAAPVIIKRKKVVAGGGHHGGAWKVAYADFVTAMMAFFLLMWLLNATTEKQRKGLSDYFNPTVPISRSSGGADGAFGGDSMFSEDTKTKTGTGGTAAEDGASSGSADDNQSAEEAEAELRAVEKALFDRGGESRTMEQLLRHVITRVTDEGLVIELFDVEGVPLFGGDGAVPQPVLGALAALLSETLSLTSNPIALNAHLRSLPVTLNAPSPWSVTADRAEALRQLLEKANLDPARISRVTGHADRRPVTADPSASRNNRLEIVLLRRDR